MEQIEVVPQGTTSTIGPNEIRHVFDGEAVSKKTKAEIVTTTGYTDETGFHELCTTYNTTLYNTTPVLDWPRRDTNIFYSYLVDWITLVILLVLIALWWAPPPKFYFRLNDPDIGYPLLPESISDLAITLTIIVGPLGVVSLAQFWVRSVRDYHQSCLAVLELFASTQLICTFMWCLIGGMRPDFLALCKPDPSLGTPIEVYPGSAQNGLVWYGDEICTCSKEDLIRSKHAFPSGHAASIVAVCVFLSIYLCAKVKLYDNRSHLWKFCIVIALFVIAVWISFSRIRDGRHHFSDVLIGMIVGLIIAPLVYRLNFCSLTGPDNHIPTRYTWRGRYFPKENHRWGCFGGFTPNKQMATSEQLQSDINNFKKEDPVIPAITTPVTTSPVNAPPAYTSPAYAPPTSVPVTPPVATTATLSPRSPRPPSGDAAV